MTDIERLVAEADHQYRHEDYIAAYNLYGTAAMSTPPTRHVMNFLNLTFERTGRQLMYELLSKYPSSFEVRRGVAMFLRNRFPSWLAARLCAELIEEGNLTLSDQHELRWMRLQALIHATGYLQSPPYHTLTEELFELWNGANSDGFNVRPRQLLDALAQIRDPMAIPALESLSTEAWLPGAVKQYLDAKVHELRVFRDVLAEEGGNKQSSPV